MIWGYAGVWMWEFIQRDEDRHFAGLKFLVDYGLKCTGIGLEGLEEMDEGKRERIFAFLEEHDLFYTIRPHIKLWDEEFSEDRMKRDIERYIKLMQRFAKPTRTRLVTFGAGQIHRFVRDPGLEEQMDRLRKALTPLAAAAKELDLPMGIENHGDYYCSDLAGLCETVPNLGIFLDTGNTFLAGERPLPAYEAAAPHVVGTHFKDHFVGPNPKELCFQLKGAIFGQGDAQLQECYDLLKAKAPDPDNLVMEMEWIPCPGHDHVEAMEESVRWIKSLN